MGRNQLPGLGGEVERRRKERGWSMEMLGSFAGLHLTTIRMIERGAAPNVANLLAIAEALGVTTSDLLGEPTGGAPAIERALPGWSRLTPAQQARIRETVADLAAAHPSEIGELAARLTPDELAAIPQGRAFQARAGRLRAAESPGTYGAGASGDTTAKPAAPRRRGARQAPP